MHRVLFVCLGNICRSPTAEGVMRRLVGERGRAGQWEIDSAGTGDWHVGQPPDRRAQAAARRAGIDIGAHRARLVTPADFGRWDWILACDLNNARDLRAMAPRGSAARVEMLMRFAPEEVCAGCGGELPDPYYGTEADFDHVVALARAACEGLFAALSAPAAGKE